MINNKMQKNFIIYFNNDYYTGLVQNKFVLNSSELGKQKN